MSGQTQVNAAKPLGIMTKDQKKVAAGKKLVCEIVKIKKSWLKRLKLSQVRLSQLKLRRASLI